MARIHVDDLSFRQHPAHVLFKHVPPGAAKVVAKADVLPGTFLAAVGADSAGKQELEPAILARGKVVADSIDQCVEIGELQHAISGGFLRREDVYAELAEIVDGVKPGRTSDDEITVFDSTGTALEDVAAAAAVYEKAVERSRGVRFLF